MRPLPKAKPTGGSHGDAFPRPQTYPYGYRATSRDGEFDDWFSLPGANVVYFGQNHISKQELERILRSLH